MIEKVIHNDILMAIIVRKKYNKDGVSFITPNEFTLQLGYMQHPQGYEVKPHMHHPVYRETNGTQEVLIIQEGEIEIDFYTANKDYIESRTLFEGDVILLISEGHGMNILKPTKMIEVKNGPYRPEYDKEKFDGRKK